MYFPSKPCLIANLNPSAKSRVLANIQETHATLSGQILSPMELSNIKLERERKSAAQLELRKAETLRLALQQQRLGMPGVSSPLVLVHRSHY
jgi:hypothetical protein